MSSPHSEDPAERPTATPSESAPDGAERARTGSTEGAPDGAERAGATPATEAPDGAWRRWLSRFETWRLLMLAGAVVLLVASIVQAVMKDDFPETARFVANVAGYVLLASGFAERMRTRSRRSK